MTPSKAKAGGLLDDALKGLYFSPEGEGSHSKFHLFEVAIILFLIPILVGYSNTYVHDRSLNDLQLSLFVYTWQVHKIYHLTRV